MSIWKPIIYILTLVVLSGCAGTAARLIADGEYLHASGEAYVKKNHNWRRWIWEQCQESVKRELFVARMRGDEKAVRDLLRKHYPPLVTREILRKLREEKDLHTSPEVCD